MALGGAHVLLAGDSCSPRQGTAAATVQPPRGHVSLSVSFRGEGCARVRHCVPRRLLVKCPRLQPGDSPTPWDRPPGGRPSAPLPRAVRPRLRRCHLWSTAQAPSWALLNWVLNWRSWRLDQAPSTMSQPWNLRR